MIDLEEIHENTGAVYEETADWWDRHRPRTLREKPWIDRFIRPLPPKGTVLDVGCGAGEPISRYLIDRGLSVTGIDSSRSMIGICEKRLPDQTWLVMDMRELRLGRSFDGIISWDGFFHLKPDEQRAALRRFWEHLRPGGQLLLTVGHEAGEVSGTVEGRAVYHSSLSCQEYEHILGALGFERVEVTLEDPMCDRSVLLATGKRS